MIKVASSDYSTDPPTDIPITDLHQEDLVVCPREGSLTRLTRLRQLGFHSATIAGWWDLVGKPVSMLSNYRVVYLLEPERISDPIVRKQWQHLVQK